MDGFDALAFGIGLIDSDNPIVQLNQKLHSSKLYNAFQIGVNAVAVFSGGMSHGMSQVTPSCFIAGTMMLTTAGLVAIENIKAGDIVISTDPDTLETAEKSVIETYIRQVDKLVHLTWKQATGSGNQTAPITTGGPDANAPLTTKSGSPVRFIVQGQDHGLNIRVIVEPILMLCFLFFLGSLLWGLNSYDFS